MNVSIPQAVVGVLALAAVGLINYQRIENNAQAATIDLLKKGADEDAATIASQADALGGIKQLHQQVADLNTKSLAAMLAIGADTAALSADLQELKRHDQTVADYLLGAVPAAVGVRWQRAASSDPDTYRQAGGAMPANAVPTPRARVDPHQ